MSVKRPSNAIVFIALAAILLVTLSLTYASTLTQDDRARASGNAVFVQSLNEQLDRIVSPNDRAALCLQTPYGCVLAKTPENLPPCPIYEALNNCRAVTVRESLIAHVERKRVVDGASSKVCVLVVSSGSTPEVVDRYAVVSGQQIDHYWCDRALGQARP